MLLMLEFKKYIILLITIYYLIILINFINSFLKVRVYLACKQTHVNVHFKINKNKLENLFKNCKFCF